MIALGYKYKLDYFITTLLAMTKYKYSIRRLAD